LSEFRKPLALVALADAPDCVIHTRVPLWAHVMNYRTH
jgi:hypothetical protein